MLKTVLTLRFDEEPNYDSIINDINQTILKENTNINITSHKFEWNVIQHYPLINITIVIISLTLNLEVAY